MSNRYDIYCINCGEQTKKIRVNSAKENSVRIDCPTCHILSVLHLGDDDEVTQAGVEISADEKTVWKNTSSDLDPFFTCPFCGHFKLETVTSDSSDFLKCNGTKCGRVIEVVYT